MSHGLSLVGRALSKFRITSRRNGTPKGLGPAMVRLVGWTGCTGVAILAACSDASTDPESDREYEILLGVDPADGGEVHPSSGSFRGGKDVRIEAEPDPGYGFDHWGGDLSGTTNPKTVSMDSDVEATAHFAPQEVELVLEKKGNGGVARQVIAGPGAGPTGDDHYLEGTEVELSAEAEEGWDFQHWEGDAQGEASTTVVTMDEPRSVLAVFEEREAHTDDLHITTKDDLAEFRAAGTEVVEGDLFVEGDELVSLSGLETLHQVTENVIIDEASSLVDIAALKNLERIGGGLWIAGNEALVEIPELPGVTSLDGLAIGGNASLETFGGLPNLEIVRDGRSLGFESIAVSIGDNPLLEELPSFPNLVATEGHLGIGANDSLEQIGGFPQLETVEGMLGIEEHLVLSEFPDFPKLSHIEWALRVLDNEALTSMGEFPALETIGGEDGVAAGLAVLIEGNQALREVPEFSTLDSAAGVIEIRENSELEVVRGFPALERLWSRDPYPFGQFHVSRNPSLNKIGSMGEVTEADGVFISENDALEDLSGFSGVTATVDEVDIHRNKSLIDISGLGNLGTTIDVQYGIEGELRIVDNPTLSQQEAEALANTVGVGGDIVISGNQGSR